MIKRELFKNKNMKLVVVAAALSASVSLTGCSAVQTNAQTETTNAVQTMEETSSLSIEETEEVKEVVDTVSPTIAVTNPRIEVVEGTAVDVMSGVTASDEKDGDLTAKITASEYDASALDVEQTITYTVADEAGNEVIATAVVVIKSNPIEALDKTMYTTSSVNVRAASNQDGEKLGSLAYAQAVHVTGKDKNTGWYQIEYTEGVVGYVSDAYLSDTKPAPKPAPSTSTNKGTTNTNKGGSTSKGSGNSSSGGSSSSSGGSSSTTQTPAPTPAPAPTQPSSGSGFKIHEPGDINNRDHSVSDKDIQHGW